MISVSVPGEGALWSDLSEKRSIRRDSVGKESWN